MSFIIGDRVIETCTTVGTGNLLLSGAPAGFQNFVSGVGNGNKTYYVATEGNTWEIGIGTIVSSAPNYITRDTVLSSSSGGGKISFSGSVDVVACVAGQEFDKRSKFQSGAYNIVEADKGRLIELFASSVVNVNLPSANAVGSGFEVSIACVGVSRISVTPAGWPIGDTIWPHVASSQHIVHPYQAFTYRVNTSANGWIVRASANTPVAALTATRPFLMQHTDGSTDPENYGVSDFISNFTVIDTSGSVTNHLANHDSGVTARFEIEAFATAGQLRIRNNTPGTARWWRTTNGGATTTGTVATGLTTALAIASNEFCEFVIRRSNTTLQLTMTRDGTNNNVMAHARWN